jgi:hypothetical protein
MSVGTSAKAETLNDATSTMAALPQFDDCVLAFIPNAVPLAIDPFDRLPECRLFGWTVEADFARECQDVVLTSDIQAVQGLVLRGSWQTRLEREVVDAKGVEVLLTGFHQNHVSVEHDRVNRLGSAVRFPLVTLESHAALAIEEPTKPAAYELDIFHNLGEP